MYAILAGAVRVSRGIKCTYLCHLGHPRILIHSGVIYGVPDMLNAVDVTPNLSAPLARNCPAFLAA